MTYFRVDDKLHDHRKSRRARKSPEGGRSAAALGLWVLAGSWSMANATDGWVPADELDRWDDEGEQLAEQLVAAELWHHHEHDGEAGYLFHEWDEWQHSQAYLAERRRRKAEHMRTVRANERAADQGKEGVDSHVDSHAEDTGQSSDDPVGSTNNPTTTTTTKTPARKRAAAPADKAGEDFARFWELYPRKTGKQDAARAFIKATKHTDVATIAAGLHNALQVWKATGVETKFIPHPATWLNRGSWDDEQPLPGADTAQPTRPATAALCDGTDCPGTRHEWTDRHGRNRFVCMGVAA